MTHDAHALLTTVLEEDEDRLLDAWRARLTEAGARSGGRGADPPELERDCRRFLQALRAGLGSGAQADVGASGWDAMRELLDGLSRDRAAAGFTPTETATFVFSVKQPLFDALRDRRGDDPGALADALWAATELIDALGLRTADAFLQTREEIIRRQQDELLELSTPVVKLWHGIVAVPLIGTLDSARTQVVMENLLERVIETDAPTAIIDITGVPTVDTLVAQHLLKTVAAARLMGADCIISGIRPQIAQTIVHLGLDLSSVTTKASLADALRLAMDRTGFEVRRRATGAAAAR